ncbi:putative Metallo-beta-lactamase superfamily protein [Priestia megaterium]|uniref:MBL fold metallo-hydrolase n=1 Tax=Priestia megaterium TaxID=1404 RepID=UPI0039E09EB7
MRIHQISRFHNIGQGLFYSSDFYLSDNRQRFRYIIDCGTSNEIELIKGEVMRYANTFGKDNKFLDVLMISHLHWDHVSGIPILLSAFKKKGIMVKRFILPYFDGPTRAFLLVKWKRYAGLLGSWFFDFIIDPLDYLVRKFGDVIKEIYVVMPSYPNNSRIDKIIPPKIKDKNDIVGVEKEDVEEPKDLKKPKGMNGTSVKYVRGCRLSIFSSIEFDFWFRPVTGSLIRAFRRVVQDSIKKEGSLENLLEKLKKGSLGTHHLVKAYDTLSSNYGMDFNDTSLCVSIIAIDLKGEFSYILFDRYKYYPLPSLGPFPRRLREVFDRSIRVSKHNSIRKIINTVPLPIEYNNLKLKFGYLFTGDMMLADKGLYDKFLSHYRLKKEKIHVLYVPHHGAKTSWNIELIKDFKKPFSVVSAREDASTGHPNYRVVNDLDLNVPWVLVNENNPFNHYVELFF